MVAQRWFIPTMAMFASSLLALAAGCTGDAGADGSSCTVTEDDAGGATIECADGTSVTVPGGSGGGACTVTDNGDGTKTIACDDGTEVVVEDGTDGTDGVDGTDVDPDTLADILERLDEASNVEPESCATCHSGAGEEHQAVYDAYVDASDLTLTIDDVNVTGTAGDYTVVLTFTITKGGLPYIDADGLPGLAQKRFIAATYDASTNSFPDGGAYIRSNFVALGGGQYTATATGIAFDPTAGNAIVYGYITDEPLHTEGGGHVHLYDNVASDAVTFGTATTTPYEPMANVSGCEKCHGEPYMKHGYRAAEVDGLGDFAACKTCHYDTRSGGHEDWQILVEDPARYAEIAAGADLTAEEEARYAYTANLMNDVHMSHAMEFPYPQSMSNCATCHEGKLTQILTVENFVVETCVSCHAWEGDETYGTADRALKTIWANAGVDSFHAWATPADAPACNSCHDALGTSATDLTDLHNGGYDPMIYSTGGAERFSEVFTVSVDTASFDAAANTLTIGFSASEAGGAGTIADFDPADIVPTVLVGLYGYDTKDFIVAAHGRDDERNRLLEFPVDGTTTNPRFTVVSASGGSWEITADLSMWSDMIADGTIRRAELGVMPALTVVVGDEDVDVGTCSPACGRGSYCDSTNTCVADDDYMLALDAPSRTFDLTANDFDDDFYNDIVEVQNCNTCHDALATTFHSANRGGNIRVCRTCHVTLNAGSHLEMQSRSIDSYVHAVHSFQAFDPGDIDFTDPVETVRYEHHVEHTFPNFTINNCESCHTPGTYNVPDQSRSLPGILSGSDEVAGRNIGDVPAVVTGPAARACGGCHRAEYINEDDASGLSAFYGHTDTNGYVVEDGEGVLDVVISEIMSYYYE